MIIWRCSFATNSIRAFCACIYAPYFSWRIASYFSALFLRFLLAPLFEAALVTGATRLAARAASNAGEAIPVSMPPASMAELPANEENTPLPLTNF